MAPILVDSGYRTSATYRLADPIENMQLEVTLRKRGTRGERRVRDAASEKPKGTRKLGRASIAFGHRAPRPDPEQEEQEDPDAQEAAAGGEVEEEDMVVASHVFHWQEKRFSPSEVSEVRKDMRRASRGEGGGGLLARFFSRQRDDFVRVRRRELLGQLDAEAEAAGEGEHVGHALHSRVDWEGDGDAAEWSARFTSSSSEAVTPLARSHLAGTLAQQHRDALGEADCARMSILAELPLSELCPDTAASPQRADLAARISERRQTISGALSRQGRGASAGREQQGLLQLCTLKLFAGGRLDVRPPLATEADGGDKPPTEERGAASEGWYRVPGAPRYEWRLRSVAPGLDRDGVADATGAGAAAGAEGGEAGREAAAGAGGAAAAAAARGAPGLDFAMPIGRTARVHYFCLIEAAQGFGSAPLYVQYFAHAAPGWRLLPECTPTAISQTSAVRGEARRAVLAFPLELSLESISEPQDARPPLTLFFSILSLDAFGRHAALGYAHAPLPARSGASRLSCSAWCPAPTRTDAQRAFFIGGSEELHDLRALSLPDGFEGATLSRHGLQTLSSGSVELQVNTVVHQQPGVAGPLSTAGAAGGAAGGTAAIAAAAAARNLSANSALRAISQARTLGASESAADRVKRRLEERRSRERLPPADASAPPAATAATLTQQLDG